MKRAQPEFRLACVVADYFRDCVPQLLVTHFPAGEHRNAITGSRLQRMGTKPGWPDYIAVLPDGRACGFELKAEGSYLRPEQKAVRDDFHARGARYYVVRSLDDVRQTLAELGVPTREARAA